MKKKIYLDTKRLLVLNLITFLILTFILIDIYSKSFENKVITGKAVLELDSKQYVFALLKFFTLSFVSITILIIFLNSLKNEKPFSEMTYPEIESIKRELIGY